MLGAKWNPWMSYKNFIPLEQNSFFKRRISDSDGSSCIVCDEFEFIAWVNVFLDVATLSQNDAIALKEAVEEIKEGHHVPLCSIFENVDRFYDKNFKIIKGYERLIRRGWSKDIYPHESELAAALYKVLTEDVKPYRLILSDDEQAFFDSLSMHVIRYDFCSFYFLCIVWDNKKFLVGSYNLSPDLRKDYRKCIEDRILPKPLDIIPCYWGVEIDILQASEILGCSKEHVRSLVSEGVVCARKSKEHFLGDNCSLAISIYDLGLYIEQKLDDESSSICMERLWGYCALIAEIVETDHSEYKKMQSYLTFGEQYQMLKEKCKRLEGELSGLRDDLTATAAQKDAYALAATIEALRIVEEYDDQLPASEKVTEAEFLACVKDRVDGEERGINIARKIFKKLHPRYRRGRGQ